MSKKILVVEDDHDVRHLVRFNLELEGFKVTEAGDGSMALAELRRNPTDLVILDLMLPKIDGLEVCRRIRQMERYTSLPILMLTARTEETDRVVGLELGADDYVTKPFSVRELVARVRALLRRSDGAAVQRKVVRNRDLTIDADSHSAMLGREALELSVIEFRLLHFLASHPGIAFSRDSLLDRVWGNDRNVTPRSVDVYVCRLREKIEVDILRPSYLQTVRGIGYRFASDDKTGGQA